MASMWSPVGVVSRRGVVATVFQRATEAVALKVRAHAVADFAVAKAVEDGDCEALKRGKRSKVKVM